MKRKNCPGVASPNRQRVTANREQMTSRLCRGHADGQSVVRSLCGEMEAIESNAELVGLL